MKTTRDQDGFLHAIINHKDIAVRKNGGCVEIWEIYDEEYQWRYGLFRTKGTAKAILHEIAKESRNTPHYVYIPKKYEYLG